MSHIELNATVREAHGKANTGLRVQGLLPAVIYGPKSKNRNIAVNYKEFHKVFTSVGTSMMLDLTIGADAPMKVLVHDYTEDPLTGVFNHVDFYAVDVTKKIEVDVTLHFENISAVEKVSGGEVIRALDNLKVECLPKDLVKEIEVDLEKYLKAIGDVLRAKDLPLPQGLELVIDPESPVASVQEIKEEIIEVAKPEQTEAEVVGEKKEGEEAGEAADKNADAKVPEGAKK